MIAKHQTYLKWFYRFVGIILIIGIFFRFTNLDQKIYWIDEVHTSLRVSGYEKVEFAETAPAGKVISIDELHQFQRLNPERGWGDTMNALAHNAEHTPIYYLLTRLAMHTIFGSSPGVTRGVAAAISLFVFPAIYWLCLELFGSPIVGAIAMCLVAVSPLHILYAQEARQYSLFTLTILLSSIALLKALPHQKETHPNQKKTWVNWAIYAASVSLNLYSHLISLLVLIGHGIYVLISQRRRDFINYLMAFGAGIISLIPWIVLYFINSNKIGGWVARDISLPTLLQRWLINLTTVFFDLHIIYPQRLFDVELGQDFALGYGNPWLYMMLLILIFVGYSLYFLCRYSPKPDWLFILTLIGTTGLALMLPDIISGGQRSGIARYLIPSYLGIELAVAYAIGHHLNLTQNPPEISVSPGQQKLWQGIFIALITLGIISCNISAPAETWWHKYSSYYNPEVAQIINQTENPLVISSQERVSRMTSLSYKLKPEVKILLLNSQQIPSIDPEFSPEFSNVFVFRPSAELYQAFEQNPNYQLIPAHPFGHLFKLAIVNR